jgi:hypothetical protein
MESGTSGAGGADEAFGSRGPAGTNGESDERGGRANEEVGLREPAANVTSGLLSSLAAARSPWKGGALLPRFHGASTARS